VNVDELEGYVLSQDFGYFVNCSAVGLGDIGIQPYTHVVMVTGLNPLRFSGHTNDRLNYPWQPELSTCINLY
jgi:hypothetical protein